MKKKEYVEMKVKSIDFKEGNLVFGVDVPCVGGTLIKGAETIVIPFAKCGKDLLKQIRDLRKRIDRECGF